MTRVTGCQLEKPLKSSFILHRYLRSEFEYIAGLGKLNPEQTYCEQAPIKNNRLGGYKRPAVPLTLSFSDNALSRYLEFMDSALSPFQSYSGECQSHVKKEFDRVIDEIRNASPAAKDLILKSTSGVKSPIIQSAISKLKSKP